jgi:WD repeat-containing protein 35
VFSKIPRVVSFSLFLFLLLPSSCSLFAKILNFDHSNIRPTNDAMCCIASNTKYLLIGRESGTIHRYTLPHISLEGKYVVRCRPQMLSINCNATRMSIIDINGILTFFDFDGSSSSSSSNGNSLDLGMTPKSGFGSPTHGRKGKQLDFERKDAWDMVWAEDNPNLFAMMEKTRMYIYRGTEPEEPVLSSGYLCQFNDLSIKAIMLDEIMSSPKEPSKDMVIDFECKSLRDVRHLLEIGLDDAGQFIEENPHPRLSKILAEAALKKLEFDLAEKSFVQCSDYQGIQFVKRLRELGNNKMQAAEVAAYFHQFDKAEDMYVAMDRKDLALELRKRLGNWRRVLALHTKWNGGDKKKRQNDATHNEVHQKLGESFYDHQKWAKAAKCFEQVKAGSGSTSSLIDCYFRSEQWSAMVTLAEELPAENVDHLNDLGERFRRAGMCGPAVDALLKAGNVKAAVDCCVLLNQWDRAVQLAQEHNFPQIESLLSEYASSMLKQNKRLEAIELYRKANKSTQAAKLLCSLAEETMQTKMNPLRAKKLYVLAALELERFKQISFSNDLTTTMNGGTTRATSAETTAATLDNLMSHDQATGYVGGGGGGGDKLFVWAMFSC